MKKYVKFWARDYTVHYNEAILQELVNNSGEFNMPDFFYLFDNCHTVAVASRKSKSRIHRGLADKYLRSYKDFSKFKKILFDSITNYLDFSSACPDKNPSKYSDKKIADILCQYYYFWRPFSKYIFWAYVLNETQADKINALVKKVSIKLGKYESLEKYLEAANRPVKKSSFLLLEDEAVKNYGKLDDKMVKALYGKYCWLPYGDLNGAEMKLADFKKYLKSLKPKTIEKAIGLKRLSRELKLTARQQDQIKINQELAYIRDYRDEVRRRAVYRIHFVYQEAARRLKISYSKLLCFSTPETIEFLRGRKVSSSEIRRRQQPGVNVLIGGKFFFLTGLKAKPYLKLYREESSKIVSGIVASRGLVTGLARIVKSDRDIKKIKKNDIMVAVTTHPDYVLKMKIAKAVITDEGGLTCHAAIVARELKIPCVVGTNNATNSFKDGDLIEVDAEKGVVRLLNK